MSKLHYTTIVTERFDWTSEDGATRISFNITALSAALKLGTIHHERICVPVDTIFVLEWLMKREPDLAYCLGLKPPRYNEPVLGITMPDGTILLIDGTHRYYAHFLSGDTTIDYFLISYSDCAPYMSVSRPPAAQLLMERPS